MYDRYHIERCDAMEWLAENYPDFPESMPDVKQLVDGISESLFRGWKFIVVEDELLFADCLSPCIRKSDMKNFGFIAV